MLTSETQNLKNKQKVIDEYLNNFLNKNLEIKKNKIDNKQINLSKIIKLGNLREMINQTQFIEQKKIVPRKILIIFLKLLIECNYYQKSTAQIFISFIYHHIIDMHQKMIFVEMKF